MNNINKFYFNLTKSNQAKIVNYYIKIELNDEINNYKTKNKIF